MQLLLFIFFLFSFFSSSIVFAGGPFFVNEEGVAAAWDNSAAIPLHPESGSCATFDNVAMLAKINQNLEHWTSITDIDLLFDVIGGEIGSVDASNFGEFFAGNEADPSANDGLNPVIFDDNGNIVEDIFGSANKVFVLGFAGPDRFSDDGSTIIDGQAFFNCFCLPDNPNDTKGECADAGVEFTEDDLNFTVMHEVGHLIGLDHTQVNQVLAEQGCNTESDGDCNPLPSMFPVSIDAADQITPQRDDQVIALTLYGTPAFEDDFCTVTGHLEDFNGKPLRCADVQATTAKKSDTIAVVSGVFAPARDTTGDGYTDDPGECLSNCGAFTLKGLNPSKTYAITVFPIDSRWVGASSINPCGSAQLAEIKEQEIATVSDCIAGKIVNLGTLKTISILGGNGDGDFGGGGCSLTR